MQSLLQYRKIGLAVQKQLSRDTEKAAAYNALAEASASSNASLSALQGDPVSRIVKSDDCEPSEDHDHAASDGMNHLMTARTQVSTNTMLGHALNGIHVRDRTTREGKGSKVFVVDWEDENDPMNPRNYSKLVRLGTTLIVAAIAFVVGAASSIDTAIMPQASAEFGVSLVVESLATGMYLVGFASGAIFAGPFSETFGRNVVYSVTLVLFMIFIMASALAPNIGAQLVFRTLAGFFGSTPLTCAGGSISDLWGSLDKTYAFPLFAIAGFGGPVLGPVIGSYIGVGDIGSWRWTEWIMLIMTGLVLALILLFQVETYPPLLLKWKARHLREFTGDDRYRGDLEIVKTTLWARLKISLMRPVLLAMEPIVMLMALYLTVLYIVLFTFLDGYAFIFSETYGSSQGLTNVIFTAMFVGMLIAFALVPWVYIKTKQDIERNLSEGDSHVHPEIRLWFAMLGGAPAIPISLFWMGWTAYPSISIWSPIVASMFFGYGLICTFMSAYMYIIDSYEIYAASALTLVTFTRYFIAGGMTVVGIPFYRNVGVHWTLTILGCISILLTPIPYVLYKYGHVVRRRSKYAVSRM
ncbi:MAG: hypothetical protein M1818_002839 [Claussenomyces sp. TS43310]|nr:MAG: hypothetical protein M1818_002839 [Claussenomyces sp. TS43310]